MSNWSTHQFTRKGEQLRAKVEAGKCKLTLTKIKIGNGNVTFGEVKDMRDLKSPQLVLGISSCDVSAEDDRICEVVGIASSSNVESAFSVTEMGLFANDPDVGEILYLMGIDTAPDDMPNKNAQSPVTMTYQFELVTSNMANVVAMISPAGLVTVKMMNTHREATELDHPDKSVKHKHLADDVYTLPPPEVVDNTRFLRNDGTYQPVSASNIGVYTKNEADTRLNAKAPLVSPAFTGTPTVPTAGKGTNNGQIANTAFVAQAIAALVNSAPGTLDTLQELAAALGNDANFATTITNALANKVSKSGDTMTGALIVPKIDFGSGYIGDYQRDTGDAIADNGGANVNISSWWGIGLYDKYGKKYTGTMDLRSGNWRTLGQMKADQGFEGRLIGKADSADNANMLGGKSLADILDKINAAKTGIVAGNLAQNGWVKFANGLIVQWGKSNVNQGTTKVTFPLTFPSLCFGVTFSHGPADNDAVTNSTVQSFTRNGADLYANAGTFLFYIALGM